MSADTILQVENLSAGYGDMVVLSEVSFVLKRGTVAAILGANGAGKTTLLSTIAGLVRPKAGRVMFDGTDIADMAAHRLPGRGLAMVPEGGRLFPFLRVDENLILGAYTPHARNGMAERMAEMHVLFPLLGERRAQHAGKLSGGERQMCAIARALMSRPRLLLLDEPSVGLSPIMSERVLDAVSQFARRERLSVLIVEQRVSEVLEIADEAHILEGGRIVRSGNATSLGSDPDVQKAYMGS